MKTEKQVVIPSDPASREKIKKMVIEISNEMAVIEGHRGVIKDTIDVVAEEFELPKKFVRKMAVAYHRQNFGKQKAEFEDFEELYGAVVEKPQGEDAAGE